MPHIVIDARLYGPKHTGIGRYTKNLLLALKKLPEFSKNRYTLLVYPEMLSEVKSDLGDSFGYYVTSIRHYSLFEQLALPILISSLKPDLVHFTHLDKPVLYFGKSVVTVHDLIRHFSKGKDTTTKNSLLYWPKYFGYLFMTRIIFMTSHIIVPSNFWRDYIIKSYRINPGRIITTYEAVDDKFLQTVNKTNNNPEDYIIYTGNLYPHKNIKVIFEALKKLPWLKLKVICARSVFSSRYESLVKKSGLDNQVEFMGYVKDEDFASLYSRALALVHPSLLEGFSLTGLEAMALNCPVISSDKSCLPEIYGDSVLYFNPGNASELADRINLLKGDANLRQDLIAKGRQCLSKYSWQQTARGTYDFYHKILVSGT